MKEICFMAITTLHELVNAIVGRTGAFVGKEQNLNNIMHLIDGYIIGMKNFSCEDDSILAY